MAVLEFVRRSLQNVINSWYHSLMWLVCGYNWFVSWYSHCTSIFSWFNTWSKVWKVSLSSSEVSSMASTLTQVAAGYRKVLNVAWAGRYGHFLEGFLKAQFWPAGQGAWTWRCPRIRRCRSWSWILKSEKENENVFVLVGVLWQQTSTLRSYNWQKRNCMQKF